MIASRSDVCPARQAVERVGEPVLVQRAGQRDRDGDGEERG